MILKENFTVPAGIGWFIFDRDSGALLWLAHFVKATHVYKPTESVASLVYSCFNSESCESWTGKRNSKIGCVRRSEGMGKATRRGSPGGDLIEPMEQVKPGAIHLSNSFEHLIRSHSLYNCTGRVERSNITADKTPWLENFWLSYVDCSNRSSVDIRYGSIPLSSSFGQVRLQYCANLVLVLHY